MSGSRYLLNTNAIVALLQGNIHLIQLLQNANWIGISVISQIEFLVFPGLAESDRQLFQEFRQRVDVIDLTTNNAALMHKIIEVRQQHRLKLPDAVIAAMAICYSASLVTADQDFSKVSDLTIINC